MFSRAVRICACGIAVFATAAQECPDSTANAVLGQIDFSSNLPNPPNGFPSSSGFSLSNAASIAVARSGRLYLSDADNHRILSWANAVQFDIGQPADMVFGQPDFVSNQPNNGGVSAHSLYLPQGLFVDENENLWVADAFNHRVLKFNSPESDATPYDADLVVGQVDLNHNDENLGLGGTGPHVALPNSLQFPGRVWVGRHWLFVADSGNSRVLRYPQPTTNTPAADVVYGQFDNFFCRAKNNDGTCENGFAASRENMKNPIGIALDSHGRLFVADWANNRILRFDPPLTDTIPEAVIGQPDFSSSFFNNGGAAQGLGLPIDLAFDSRDNLFVADSGNNRILVYESPLSSVPTCVLGQLDQLGGVEPNHGLGFFSTDAEGLSGPTGVVLDRAGNIYLADTNNQRALRFVRGCGFGDMNSDGLVAGDDAALWSAALIGPASSIVENAKPRGTKECADLDGDEDVDLADLARLQLAFGVGL
ncbi:MAG: hypothetical protein AB7N71_02280 [Phycisphaerae bacterium]